MAYLGRAPNTGVRTRFIFTATASQTTFSGADDNGVTLKYEDAAYVDVFLNGVLLIPVTDYAATTKTSVVLTSGAAVSDIVEIVAYDIANIADTVSKADGGTFDGDVTFNGAFTSQGIDDNATSTAMTVDSNGDVLVGTTSFSSTTAGIKLDEAGDIAANRDGGAAAFFGRLTSDGEIVRFRKDGTTVGSIGVNASDNIWFAGGAGSTKGIHINNSGVMPADTGGATLDAGVNLGVSSVRWQNLYLSGGIYLGGTGSANYLDDYEEGTYTPVFSAGPSAVTYNVQVGTYTKVGNLVVVAFAISMTAFSGTASHTQISLPFTSANTSNLYHPSCLQIDNLTADNRQVGIQINPNTNNAILIRNIGTTSAHDGLNSNRINQTSTVRGTVVYRTT